MQDVFPELSCGWCSSSNLTGVFIFFVSCVPAQSLFLSTLSWQYKPRGDHEVEFRLKNAKENMVAFSQTHT